MIRKLIESDHEQLIDFLKEEQAINLFIIGDIESFGYDIDFQELWAEYDENNEMIAVMLRFFSSYIPYAKGAFNVQGFANIIKEDQLFNEFSGKAAIAEQFEDLVPLGKKQSTFFAELRDTENLTAEVDTLLVKRATMNDIDRILDIRSAVFGPSQLRDGREKLMKSMENNSSRSYYIEEEGKIVSIVSTAAENSLSAMIIGVGTVDTHRKRGYASRIMTLVAREALSEGKSLCLFYDNPAAGKIYKQLGFKDIGMWNMYR